jgi:tetratricopeptide (TPR) repeat protein
MFPDDFWPTKTPTTTALVRETAWTRIREPEAAFIEALRTLLLHVRNELGRPHITVVHLAVYLSEHLRRAGATQEAAKLVRRIAADVAAVPPPPDRRQLLRIFDLLRELAPEDKRRFKHYTSRASRVLDSCPPLPEYLPEKKEKSSNPVRDLLLLPREHAYRYRFAEAAAVRQQALELGERTLDPSHPDTLAAWSDLAHFEWGRRRFRAAEEAFWLIIDRCVQREGRHGLDAARAYGELADLYRFLGDYSFAALCSHEEWLIEEAADVPYRAPMVLAECLAYQGQVEEARKYFTICLELWVERRPDGYLNTFYKPHWWQIAYLGHGTRELAKERLHERDDMIEKKLRRGDVGSLSNALDSLDRKAAFLRALNRPAEAAEVAHRAAAIRQELRG